MAEKPSAEDWERFAAIVRKGGTIVCAPDVYAALMSHLTPPIEVPFGTEIRLCEWMAPGSIMAMAKSAPLKLDVGGVDLVVAYQQEKSWLTPPLTPVDPEADLRRSTYQRPSDDDLRARIRDEFGV